MVIQNKHTHYSPNHKPDHHKSAKPLGIMGGSSLNKAWYALEYVEYNNKVSYHYQPTLVYTPSTHAISDTVCASNFIPPGNYCNQLTSISNILLVGLPMEHHFKQPTSPTSTTIQKGCLFHPSHFTSDGYWTDHYQNCHYLWHPLQWPNGTFSHYVQSRNRNGISFMTTIPPQ